jgi:hypothetical protein
MTKNDRAKRQIQKFVATKKRQAFGNKRQIKGLIKLSKLQRGMK